MSRIVSIGLDCGIPLLVERIDSVASLAMNWLVPAGSATDPDQLIGASTLLSEYIFRGAGELSSRELSDTFDRLGVRRSGHVGTHHLQLSATMLGDKRERALPVLVSLILNPQLPEEALTSIRSLCLQSLDSLSDDPQHQVMLELRRRHRPAPFNRNGYGERSVLEEATLQQLQEVRRSQFRPGGSIIAAAGHVDPHELAAQFNTLFSGFTGDVIEPQYQQEPLGGYEPIEQETAQVHIGLAYGAPAEPDPNSTLEHLATSVLSGGTSGRLFTEVRQRRSLCYSVGASYSGARDDGVVSVYAGTTPERAQETLDVTVEQIHRMNEGATATEFDRAITKLKSRLVMQGESTQARAAALGQDQFRLGHARSLKDRVDAIEKISLDQLNSYLAERQFGPFTIASIGPQALNVPEHMAPASAG